MTDEPPLDEYDAHFRREPRAGAAIRVLALDSGRPERAGAIAEGLAGLIRGRGREASWEVLPSRADAGLGPTIDGAVAEAEEPLVLLTTAVEPWSAGHLEPLLGAIDRADHVVGRRPASIPGRLARRLDWLRWRALFAVPVVDVHSPCRLHRREALAALPLQSESEFVDVELLAKATFLGHLIAEVDVPALEAGPGRPGGLRRFDFAEVFRHPVFSRSAPISPRPTRRASPASGPAEDPQREQERGDGPGGQDGQRQGEVGQALALEDDQA